MLKQSCNESVSSFQHLDEATKKRPEKRVHFQSRVEIISITAVTSEDYWYGEEDFESQRELKKDLLRLTDYTQGELWDLFGYIIEDKISAGCSKLTKDLGIKSVLLQQDLQRSLGTQDPHLISQSYTEISRLSFGTARLRAKNLETEVGERSTAGVSGNKSGMMNDSLKGRVERRWM